MKNIFCSNEIVVSDFFLFEHCLNMIIILLGLNGQFLKLRKGYVECGSWFSCAWDSKVGFSKAIWIHWINWDSKGHKKIIRARNKFHANALLSFLDLNELALDCHFWISLNGLWIDKHFTLLSCHRVKI